MGDQMITDDGYEEDLPEYLNWMQDDTHKKLEIEIVRLEKVSRTVGRNGISMYQISRITEIAARLHEILNGEGEPL